MTQDGRSEGSRGWERRSVLRGLALGLGSLPLRAVVGAASDQLERLAADVETAASPQELWRRVRAEFRLEPGLVHLNSGTLGACPTPVIDAAADALRELEGNPARRMFGPGTDHMDRVRLRAAAFLGGDPDEVALTRNTTEAMNAIAEGLDLRPGDGVLTSNHEHGGGMVCWQHLRQRREVGIDYFELPRKVRSARQVVELVTHHLTPRTRVVSLSHVDTICGVRLPMAELAAELHERDILLVCDGAQAPGMIDVDVKALGVDAYACSAHKWLLGPKGTGLLYIRREAQERIRPGLLYSGYAAYTASGGTRDLAGIVGLAAALDFQEAVGRERIVDRCRELAVRVRTRLETLDGLVLLTPVDPDLSGAIVTATVKRGDAGDLVARMGRDHGVVLKRAQSTYAYCTDDDLAVESYNAIRFSPHVYNDEAEIDRAVGALGSLLDARQGL
jgi:selenocysteine lyase/cysteine desulfurase